MGCLYNHSNRNIFYRTYKMDLDFKTIRFIQTVKEAFYGMKVYAGNSGGKDSAVLDHLLQRAGIKYESYYTNTTIDPKGTIRHIRENYPHTKILHPKLSFYELVEKKGLPTRLNRYCCDILKEYGSVGRAVFEGVRSCESTNRQGRDYIQCDRRKSQKGSKHIYPLYDWSDKDIWDYIEKHNIKLAPAYGLGLKRLGCVGCPQVTKKGQREFEFSLYPRVYDQIKRSISKGMNNNPQWKITQLSKCDSQIAMDWWLSGKTMNEYFKFNQITPTP